MKKLLLAALVSAAACAGLYVRSESAGTSAALAAGNRDGNPRSVLATASYVAKTSAAAAREARVRLSPATSASAPAAPVEPVFPRYELSDAPGEAARPTSAESSVDAPAVLDTTVFQGHTMTSAEAPAAVRAHVAEPTAINVGDAVLFTGTSFAAVSLDGGSNFGYIDPATAFPAANGGFCCHQVTAYASAQDMALWGMQYNKDANSNTIRIARTIGRNGISSGAWLYYDLTPANFGYAAGNWLDFPDVVIGSTFAYFTANVFTTSNNTFVGSVVWRISLAQLAAGGTVNLSYFTFADVSSPRLARGSTTTMHFVVQNNTAASVRIYHWPDASSSITSQTVAVSAYNPLNRDGVATSIDSTNWAGRADSRILAAFVSGGVIGAMWGAKQGGAFPFPYVVDARFNETTGALVTERQIWNSNYAYLYPAANVAPNGDVGGALQFGGGAGVTTFPASAVWVVDGAAPTGAIAGFRAVATSSNGPSSNAWGDYLAVQPHKLFPNTWVMGAHFMEGGTAAANTSTRYVWFGRAGSGPAALSRRAFDFDGDAKTDVSIFRPNAVGEWWYRRSTDAQTVAYQFGAGTDKIVPADYTGDGKADSAVFRAATGQWFVLRSEDFTFYAFPFGNSTDAPIAGDYDGDGKADPAVFRASSGTWFIQNSGGGTQITAFGAAADKPVAGDFDGDGKTDVAIFRPNAAAEWWWRRSSDGVTAALQFGLSTDKAVPADFTGDFKTDVAFFRPSTGQWFVLRSEDSSFYAFPFGASGDTPAPGDYDGDGRTDAAVFRPAVSTWFINGSTSGTSIIAFGAPTDRPVPNAYVP